MLPNERDVTLIPGVSPLPAATGNALQDQAIITRRALSGGDMLIMDEFAGSVVDTTKWATISAAGVSIANGGLQLSPNYGGGAADALVATAGLKMASLPFRASALVLPVAAFFLAVPHNAGLDIGITNGSTGTRNDPNALFFTGKFGDNWSCVIGAGTFPTTVPCVNVGANAKAQLLEIWRDAAGVVSFVIDGVVVVQLASPGDLLPASGLVLNAWHTLSGSNTDPIVIDAAKIWVARYPVSATSGPPTPSPHFESGRAAFDGATNGPDGTTRTRRINFATTFGNAGASLFKFNATLGPGNVRTAVSISNIDANGSYMDIRVEDATFVGPVSWQAYL